MSKRVRSQVEGAPALGSQPKQFDQIQLDAIKKLQQSSLDHANAAVTHQIKAQTAEAEMRLRIAEGLISLGFPVTGSLVCLGCGTVRSETQPPQACPGCGVN